MQMQLQLHLHLPLFFLGRLQYARRFFNRSSDIFSPEHIQNSCGGAGVKSRLMFEVFWIPEGSENDIEQGQIGIVVLMDALRMMERMTLRTLDNVAEPLRRSYVGMLEDGEEVGHQDHHRNCLRC